MEENENNKININELKFDVLKIDNEIKINKSYKDDNDKSIFLFCEEYNPDNKEQQDSKIDFPKYIAIIKRPNFEYFGTLSRNLKKESYGYNIFDNGDEYFGQWNKDKKEGYGIYYFKEQGSEEIKHVYIGEFKNNVKSGEGIYFKVSAFSEEKKDKPTPTNFSAIIGTFSEDNYMKGIIFSYADGKRKIYKGKMKDGKKNDDNTEIYEDNNKIFHGKIEDNMMIEGRIIIMKDDKKETGYYFTKSKDKDDFDFEYDKEEKDDDKFIRKLNDYNGIFDTEKIKDLFRNVIDIKTKYKYDKEDDLDKMKKLKFDEEIKQVLKEQYGKYLYC